VRFAVSSALTFAVALAPAWQEQRPLFRTTVDRVLVDVVVTDDNDRPITDLTQEDFAVVESGRSQAITDFRFVSVPVANRVLEPRDRAAAASDVATNAPASELSRLWAIIVDDLHLIEAHIIPVKRILADFVRALPSQDEVAVVYVGRSDISVNFTSDPTRLLAAIERVRNAVGFGLDAFPRGRNNRHVKRQAETTADAIRSVAASLAGSGHRRRAIVYLGTMTTISPEDREGVQYIADFLEPAFEDRCCRWAHSSDVLVQRTRTASGRRSRGSHPQRRHRTRDPAEHSIPAKLPERARDQYRRPGFHQQLRSDGCGARPRRRERQFL
jgi:VWFA-related protein